MHLDNKDTKDAIPALEKAIKMNGSNNSEAYNYLGLAHRYNQDLD